MRVILATGVTSVEGEIIETATQKLLIHYKPAAVAAADQETEFRDVKFEAQIMSPNGGTHPLVYPTKLADLMEIAASNEGFVKLLSDGTRIGTIELSNVGALDLGKDQLSVSVTKMLAGATLEVYNLDSERLTKSFIQYNPINFQADAPKEIDVAEFYQIALPKGSVTKIELKYPNGRNISFVPNELDAICDEINPLAEVKAATDETGANVIVTGSKNWYCLGIGHAISAKVSLSAAGNCYFVKNSNLQS